MFNRIVTAAVFATSAIAGTAFASGYGPAPHYDALAGAPASQRGVSAQTVAFESMSTDSKASGYGGVADTVSQAGARTTTTAGTASLFAHH
ncbi:hypothetical protein [Paraburkholderia sp. DGU8]|jgi:hypothetical protein|uniref:hypothetical protein n=1 Tax=Paraburkholderia sp. DGU8 TaxID=3161997 RepID=UPI0034675A4C